MMAPRQRPRIDRRVAIAIAALLLAGIFAYALSSLGLQRIGHALISASPGWVLLALVLMGLSLLLRSVSWHQTLRAALPDASIRWATVARATMVGVMGSAVFPGRVGEPTRVLMVTRRLQGPSRRVLPIVAGTVFSQTLINLFALAVLAAVTFTSVPLLQGHESGLEGALAVPLVLAALVLAGPRLLALGRRSRSPRVQRLSSEIARLLALARQGLTVFARPRHGSRAVAAQLLAWALQWTACYTILLALGLQSRGGLVAAAAILLAVNVSAVLPATPSNVGVFQAACVVVLSAYGASGGTSLAYGIILQAVEVITALALGVPALLAEGMTWSEIRGVKQVEAEVEAEDEEVSTGIGP
jgi:phosphatidyl-myo-inositol alpha-mannosyltransferase